MVKEMKVRVTDNAGNVWEFPVDVVIRNHAELYKRRFDGDFERSLKDSIEYFEDGYDVLDWARNNMYGDELAPHAKLVKKAEEPTFEDAWDDASDVVVLLGKV